MTDDTFAALDRAATEHGLLPSQSGQISVLCAALQAFERHTDPTRTAEPLTLFPCAFGLAVWRFPGWEAGDLSHELLGLICCTTEDWWPFVPTTALPAEVLAAATATWPATPATSGGAAS